MKKEDEFVLNVQCTKCKKQFNFASYLNEEDIGKNIAELVIEKCHGNDILCKDCLKKSKKLLISINHKFFELPLNGKIKRI
ncbi:MAG: hypothetical protein N3D20_01805 [Candidatus Pacearchaeota archaeon]|nr:hypothetical protein [Candidatus Pacearchaeota archaeon]